MNSSEELAGENAPEDVPGFDSFVSRCAHVCRGVREQGHRQHLIPTGVRVWVDLEGSYCRHAIGLLGFDTSEDL